MLKKVFISLLILSAISAEGAINPSLDIYNLYFRYVGLLEASDNQGASFESMSEESSRLGALSEAEQNNKLALSNSDNNIKNSKSVNYSGDFILPESGSLIYNEKYNSNEAAIQATRKVITLKSGLSPPYLLV